MEVRSACCVLLGSSCVIEKNTVLSPGRKLLARWARASCCVRAACAAAAMAAGDWLPSKVMLLLPSLAVAECVRSLGAADGRRRDVGHSHRVRRLGTTPPTGAHAAAFARFAGVDAVGAAGRGRGR